ncbi:hypothetical protein ACQPXB_37250 [Amycolatopsis sp. CA-161197]|uniref:hypothetical protein n=1 Tax=Amycolatopsis sp. CA-161197 TaxID=3239922 RepID=UPI003D8B502D
MWHESRRLVADGRTFGSAATVVRTRIAGDVVGHPISVAADQTAVESSRYVQSAAAGQATPANRAESDRSGACTPDVRPHWFDALARGISGVPHRSSTGTGDARAAMLADGVRALAAPNPACARVGPNGALSADPSKAQSFWLTTRAVSDGSCGAAPRSLAGVFETSLACALAAGQAARGSRLLRRLLERRLVPRGLVCCAREQTFLGVVEGVLGQSTSEPGADARFVRVAGAGERREPFLMGLSTHATHAAATGAVPTFLSGSPTEPGTNRNCQRPSPRST